MEALQFCLMLLSYPHGFIQRWWILIHNFSVITCCLLLCSPGMPEHGVTKSRNKRTRKERWWLLATKFNLLQTYLEISPSCDCRVNGRRAHGWLLLYGSFWLEQQSICKHEEPLQLWNKPFTSFPEHWSMVRQNMEVLLIWPCLRMLQDKIGPGGLHLLFYLCYPRMQHILFQTGLGHLSQDKFFAGM